MGFHVAYLVRRCEQVLRHKYGIPDGECFSAACPYTHPSPAARRKEICANQANCPYGKALCTRFSRVQLLTRSNGRCIQVQSVCTDTLTKAIRSLRIATQVRCCLASLRNPVPCLIRLCYLRRSQSVSPFQQSSHCTSAARQCSTTPLAPAFHRPWNVDAPDWK